MPFLRECYVQLKDILGSDIEPYESVELVEKYRRYWKPEKVRVILLAESHVFTSTADMRIELPAIPSLEGYPTSYAKFVYCLGYGERQLTQTDDHPKGDGTPQFWKLFYACNNRVTANNDFVSVLSKTPYEQRIQNKINLLKSLKSNGIWLVDSSIVALYHKGAKPDSKKMSSVIRASWTNYTKGVVTDSKPEHVIVIGKGVAKEVENDLRHLGEGKCSVIEQPNAYLSAAMHLANFRKYYEVCRQ